MITEKVIDTLYKKYRKAPDDPYSLDIPLLFDGVNEVHGLEFQDANDIVIGSIPASSPFHTIELKRVNAIVPFEEWVAIVLHSSIIFLNKKSPKTYLHIRALKRSLIGRLGDAIGL